MNTIKLNTLGDKVIVRKAAENGGNAGGAPSGGSSWKYYNVADSNALGEVGLFFLLMKYTDKGSTNIASMIDYHSSTSLTVRSVAIDENIKINLDGTVMTALEWLAALGITDMSAVGFTEITEEEFYNTAV